MSRSASLAVVVMLAGCDGGSGFAGTYETTAYSVQDDGCGGMQAPEMIPVDEHWFRLDDVDDLVAYYPCAVLGQCDDLYDLVRSFGRAKEGDGWEGYLGSALPDPDACILRYQVRRLEARDGGIEIITKHYRMADATLFGAACSDTEASMRGTSMPCVDESHQIAESR